MMDEVETRAAAAKPPQYPFTASDIEVIREMHERMKQCESEEDE